MTLEHFKHLGAALDECGGDVPVIAVTLVKLQRVCNEGTPTDRLVRMAALGISFAKYPCGYPTVHSL